MLLAFLTALAWWALWRGEHSRWGHALLHSRHAAQGNVDALTFGAVFVLGWTIMTIAMMLPTSSPLFLLFHAMVADRRDAYRLLGLLAGGYLFVWTLFGLFAFLLNRAANSVDWLVQNARAASALILLVAGLYQFSPLKYACLDKCRSPMLFLVERWSSSPRGSADAFRVGTAHGLYCVGCCWALMLVMVAAGAGSLAWMLVLGIAMAMEKNLPWGRRLGAPIGVVLLVAAVAAAIS
jgi:predicted metal-binding membrane protein